MHRDGLGKGYLTLPLQLKDNKYFTVIDLSNMDIIRFNNMGNMKKEASDTVFIPLLDSRTDSHPTAPLPRAGTMSMPKYSSSRYADLGDAYKCILIGIGGVFSGR